MSPETRRAEDRPRSQAASPHPVALTVAPAKAGLWKLPRLPADVEGPRKTRKKKAGAFPAALPQPPWKTARQGAVGFPQPLGKPPAKARSVSHSSHSPDDDEKPLQNFQKEEDPKKGRRGRHDPSLRARLDTSEHR